MTADLATVVERLKAQLEAKNQRIQQLMQELELLKRYLFGPRSERRAHDPNQGLLFAKGGGEADTSVTTPADEDTVQVSDGSRSLPRTSVPLWRR